MEAERYAHGPGKGSSTSMWDQNRIRVKKVVVLGGDLHPCREGSGKSYRLLLYKPAGRKLLTK